MARFLLVHGAAHGAWCWRDVLPALRALGHTAHALDLPSHGDDQTAPEGVVLTDYARAILQEIEAPTILVGHSMGGYPITLAAEMAAQVAPGKISGLLYLCAYTPSPNLGLVDMRKRAAEQPLREAMRVAKDRKTMTFDPSMAKAKFYHDCPEGTVEFAIPRLSIQPIAPMHEAVATKHALTLPRGYVICCDDRAIPPDFQREMAAHFPHETRYELETSHSPFFAAPEKLAAILSDFATKI